jgi:hypothetical protein
MNASAGWKTRLRVPTGLHQPKQGDRQREFSRICKASAMEDTRKKGVGHTKKKKDGKLNETSILLCHTGSHHETYKMFQHSISFSP